MKKINITPETYQKMEDEFQEEGLAFTITIPTQDEIDKWEDEVPVPTPPVHNHDMVVEAWEKHNKKMNSMKYKAKIYIRLRAQVDDSAGNAVRQACGRLSDLNIQKLRLGKMIEIDFEAPNKEYAKKEIETLSNRLFANTVIEDYEVWDIWEVD